VQISSAAGDFGLPGYAKPLRVGPVLGCRPQQFLFELLPVQLLLSNPGKKESPKRSPKKPSPKNAAALAINVEFSLPDDFHRRERLPAASPESWRTPSDFFKRLPRLLVRNYKSWMGKSTRGHRGKLRP